MTFDRSPLGPPLAALAVVVLGWFVAQIVQVAFPTTGDVRQYVPPNTVGYSHPSQVDFVILLRANDAFLAGLSGHDAIIERARATDPWKRPYPYGPLLYWVLSPNQLFQRSDRSPALGSGVPRRLRGVPRVRVDPTLPPWRAIAARWRSSRSWSSRRARRRSCRWSAATSIGSSCPCIWAAHGRAGTLPIVARGTSRREDGFSSAVGVPFRVTIAICPP